MRQIVWTSEQSAIIEAHGRADMIAVLARAGCGKTTECEGILEAYPDIHFLYVAFNKKVRDEAVVRFARFKNVTVKTAHQIAYGAVGYKYANAGRLTTSDYATRDFFAVKFRAALARHKSDSAGAFRSYYSHALEALANFISSADVALGDRHVPREVRDREWIARAARGMWTAIVSLESQAPVTHDAYLKAYQVAVAGGPNPTGSRTTLPYGVRRILFDEAQDASAAMIDIMFRSGKPMTIIGDPRQQIYSFRGSMDAFSLPGFERFLLTHTWRFNQAMATPGNRVLASLGETELMQGMGASGEIVPYARARPDVVISRSNAGLFGKAIKYAGDRAMIHIVGGENRVLAWAQGAYDLWIGSKVRHPAFALFESWSALEEAVEDETATELAPYVKLVQSHQGHLPGKMSAIRRCHVPRERDADVVLTTSHGAKGQEWDVVEVGDDFRAYAKPVGNSAEINDEEANLAYVTLTRAKKTLALAAYAPILELSIAATGRTALPGLLTGPQAASRIA